MCRPAAGFSYRNPVERVHAIANLGLQSVGIMRQKMSADMEERIRNCNSNEELRKAIERHEELRPVLENSLSVPIDLLNSVFGKLSLKDKRFQTFTPCTAEELTNYHLPNDRFDENISELKKKEHLKNFPKLTSFNVPIPLGVLITCTSLNARLMIALFIFLLGKIESFGDPIPHNHDEGNGHYHLGEDPEEKFIPSKLEILPKGVTVSLPRHRRKQH